MYAHLLPHLLLIHTFSSSFLLSLSHYNAFPLMISVFFPFFLSPTVLFLLFSFFLCFFYCSSYSLSLNVTFYLFSFRPFLNPFIQVFFLVLVILLSFIPQSLSAAFDHCVFLLQKTQIILNPCSSHIMYDSASVPVTETSVFT